GEAAQCTLLYCPEDRALIEFLIGAEIPTGGELRRLFALLRSRAGSGAAAYVRSLEIERALDMRETKVRLALHHLERAGILTRAEDSAAAMTLTLRTQDLPSTQVAEI